MPTNSDFGTNKVLPKGWSFRRLVDCTSDGNISYGIVQPGTKVKEGIPILRVNNIKNGTLDTSDVLVVKQEIEEKFKKTRLSGGEVVLSLVGSTGQSLVIPDELYGWNVARAVAVIRPSTEIGPDWINICLKSRDSQTYLDARANTTVQKTLNLKDVRELPIPLAPKQAKEFIENCLTSLHKKIELNRQINQTLESMAQALFKSWFLDFDPVIDNALAAGKEIPEPFTQRAIARRGQKEKAITGGSSFSTLPEDIRQLFPSAFQFTEELGWIPAGWESKKCEEIAEKIAMGPFGSNIKVSTFVEHGVPIISGHHLNETLLTEGNHNFITDEHAEKLKNSCVKSGDLIFTHAGNIGQVALIPKSTESASFIISQRQFYLRPIDKPLSSYLVYFFRSPIGQHKLLANASQVGVPSIARPSSHLKGIEFLLPNSKLLAVFDKSCQSIFRSIISRRKQSDTLTKVRDLLLPKLISGELQIPDVETLAARYGA